MEIFKLLSITLGAILANNFIFSQFLGCCPFLGVSKKVDTAVGMGVAVTFVMGLASAVCYVVNQFILVPLDLAYMQTVAFILVIASLVQTSGNYAAMIVLPDGYTIPDNVFAQ